MKAEAEFDKILPVFQDYMYGFSTLDIAENYNIPRTELYVKFRKFGIPTRGSPEITTRIQRGMAKMTHKYDPTLRNMLIAELEKCGCKTCKMLIYYVQKTRYRNRSQPFRR